MQRSPHEVVRLSSSMRTRSLGESLAIARSMAPGRGISRVVDITRLDRIGIPVFTSVRPSGLKGTLCVHAGKGLRPEEAEIGAYMEAIEFSYGPADANAVDFTLGTAEDVCSSFGAPFRFVDLCPKRDRRLGKGDHIAIIEAQLLDGSGKVVVPAELIYFPMFGVRGTRLFGSSTNGLASGNCDLEAVLHGLTEVMERHCRSFDLIKDSSLPVDLSTVPDNIGSLVSMIQQAGLTVSLRYSNNDFNLPYFSAYILDRDEHESISVAQGFGLHLDASIAAIRAICEAAQARLSHIHGGRDDIIRRRVFGEKVGEPAERRLIQVLRANALKPQNMLEFKQIPSVVVSDLSDGLAYLLRTLKAGGFGPPCWVRLNEPVEPMSVVRVVVPGCEHFDHETERVGPRLIERIRMERSRGND